MRRLRQLMQRLNAACDALEDHPHAPVWGVAMLLACLWLGLILTGAK
jgi:hypothetical protein